MTTKDLVPSNPMSALTLPDVDQFKRDIAAINRFQQVVHATMIEGQDYGVIPGTQKPTLLKPGAEKIAKLLGLADTYDILNSQEDWSKPFFRYLVKCKLIHIATGNLVSEGMGECNSYEGKYRWRESKRKCPTCGSEAIIKGKQEYGGGWICFKKQGGCGAKFEDNDKAITEQTVGRVENEDIYSQVNTILKMAKKRALVDAALSAGRLSDVFTQDMEELAPKQAAAPAPNQPATKPSHPVAAKPIVVEAEYREVVQPAPEQAKAETYAPGQHPKTVMQLRGEVLDAMKPLTPAQKKIVLAVNGDMDQGRWVHTEYQKAIDKAHELSAEAHGKLG